MSCRSCVKTRPRSFKVLGRFYARDAAGVFYRQHPVAGADAGTFRVVADDRAEDAGRTYWQSLVETTRKGKGTRPRRGG